MRIQVNCPKCGKAYKLSTDFCGKKVSCKECGNVFRLGTAPPTEPVFEVTDDMLVADEPAYIAPPTLTPPPPRQNARFRRPPEQKPKLQAGYHQPAGRTAAGPKKCVACRKPIAQDATRCPHCTEYQRKQDANAALSRTPLGVFLGIIGMIFVGLIAFGILFGVGQYFENGFRKKADAAEKAGEAILDSINPNR